MGCWTHIILESYCMYRSRSQKVWKGTEWVPKKRGRKKTFIHKNEGYVPKSKRPLWCRKTNRKRLPQFKCLCDNKEQRCPFFAMTNADKKDYRLFGKVWDEANKMEEL